MMMRIFSRKILIFVILLLPLLVSCAAFAATSAEEVEKELCEAARRAVTPGDWDGFQADVEKRISALFKDPAAVKQADMISTLFFFRRVGRYFPSCSVNDKEKFLGWLLDHRNFCRRFLNALDRFDRPDRAFEVLKDLFDIGEARFLEFGELAIAYSVVWDDFQPHYLARANEIPADRYKEAYKFYVANNARMIYDLRQVPWEISQYVVASAVSPEERAWALDTYRGKIGPKQCYFDVKYDTDSLKKNVDKKIEGKPYTLMNLHSFGGVCCDRSYYAVNVCRVFGIPAVYISGHGRRGGHAWVGYLETQGKRVDWNVHVGRFAYDHYYQGELIDYTSNNMISDGELRMIAGLFQGASAEGLNSAAAFRDAAEWVLDNLLDPNAADLPQWRSFEEKPKKRTLNADHADLMFSLLAESLRLSPYDSRTWLFLADLGRRGYLTNQQMDSSFAFLCELALKPCPDFSFTVFESLTSGIEDIKFRCALYERGLKLFKFRPDLGAGVKLLEGQMWEDVGNDRNAVEAYGESIQMFKKESHVVTTAFRKLDAIYREKHRTRDAVRVYSEIWPTLEQPRSHLGYDDSLYKLMGDRLEELLRNTGDERGARRVRRQLETVERSLTW